MKTHTTIKYRLGPGILLGALCCAACEAPDGSDTALEAAFGPLSRSELALGERPVPLRAAEPRILDEAELEYVTGLRRELDFESDPDYVQDLYADPASFGGQVSSGNELLGLILTYEEIARMRTRNRLEHHGGELEAWFRRVHPGVYAGILVVSGGPDGGGLLVARVTGDPEALLREVEAQLPAELRGHLLLEQVPFSMDELVRHEAEVSRFLSELQAHGYEFNASAVDLAANRVTVFVPRGASTGMSEALRRRFGLDRIGVVEEKGRAAPSGWLKNQAYEWALAAGGQQITDYISNCTSGISAHGYFGPFMLTAGHCFASEKSVYQGGDKLGVVKARSISGKMDVEAISTFGERNTAGRFHRNANDFWSPVHWAIGLEKDTLGSIVCTSGTTTTGLDGFKNAPYRCGKLIQRYVRPNYKEFPNFSANFRIAQFASNPGDSGALVYWDTIYGTGAVGIVSGYTGEGFGVYSHLPYALEQWGLTLDAPG